jgi:hypothetical protein
MVRRGSPVRVRKRASIYESVGGATEALSGASFIDVGEDLGKIRVGHVSKLR